MIKIIRLGLILLIWNSLGNKLSAQLTLPPSGDNQKSIVTQYMGMVGITINYSSPDVHGLNGEDRTGHIWGELVPYGLSNQQFGLSTDANPSPWRGGANENTTINFTHDILVEGKKLKAGIYGLHFIPGVEEWTVIFSSNSTAWGSFFYEVKDDVLRVKVKPEKNNYHEWLNYEFTDRQPSSCIVAMEWENLKVPVKFSVEDIVELYINTMRNELKGETGFDYMAWVNAANYCVQNNRNLNEALTWANYAIEEPFFGRKNFTSYSCKAGVLRALGKAAQSDSIMLVAINDPTASMMDIHYYARGLQVQKRNKEALEIFLINYKKYPKDYVTNLGLARGYSANGDYSNALKYAKSGLALDPNPQVKQTLEDAIKKLEMKQDFN